MQYEDLGRLTEETNAHQGDQNWATGIEERNLSEQEDEHTMCTSNDAQSIFQNSISAWIILLELVYYQYQSLNFGIELKYLIGDVPLILSARTLGKQGDS